MNTQFDTTMLAVCTVCLALLANGEYDDGTDAAEKCSAGQVAIWGEVAIHLTPGKGEAPWFSWQSCDGCGDKDGGDRHVAYVMIPRPSELTK